MRDDMTRRADQVARLAAATAVLEARAQDRLALEQPVYADKLAQRAEQERTTGRRPRVRQ